jgi:hypothetical protein
MTVVQPSYHHGCAEMFDSVIFRMRRSPNPPRWGAFYRCGAVAVSDPAEVMFDCCARDTSTKGP